jgi:hypothetical protein
MGKLEERFSGNRWKAAALEPFATALAAEICG